MSAFRGKADMRSAKPELSEFETSEYRNTCGFRWRAGLSRRIL